jgi:Dolichyl-phosphate-mannose-protein mannosyltransferase
MTSQVMDEGTVTAVPVQVLYWPRALAGGIFVLLGLIILTTFRDYGISWDEQLQNTYGKLLLDYYTTGFADRSAFSYINLFLYGGFFDLLAAAANLVSPFGEYETRHLLGGLIFLVGLWGGWKLTRLLAGERAALVALICLATTPLLYGHGFINPKDSPLAWLGIWTTYFMCRILGASGLPSWDVIVGFAISLGLTIGTRVAGIAYLDYFAVVFVVGAVAQHLKGETWRVTEDRMRASAVRLAAALILALGTMALVWPWSVQRPLNILAALSAFTHFAFYPKVLWNGELIPADQMPQTYLPGLLLLQLPEYVLLGLISAAMFGFLIWRRHVVTLFAEPRAQQYLYVICSFVAPLAGYLLLHPTVYNGLRHFLFIVPPLVILSAIGLYQLISFVAKRNNTASLVLSAVLALSLAREAMIMIGLHPYEYVAYNSLIGGVKGAADRFELDYWGTSLAESARDLGVYLAKDPVFGLNSSVKAKVFACGDRTSAGHFLPANTELTEVLPEADFYMGMTGVHCLEPIDKPYHTVVEVKRLGVTLGYVHDLRPPAP